MGYPRNSEADALAVIQQLIDRGTLLKVQDEQGNAIEDWGVFGGWTNGIGNFKPGKGYKIKVNADDTLTMYESYTKSSSSPVSHAKPVYFKSITQGNGVDHMNINLVDIPEGLLQEGDEIGVFDGNLCVGAVKCMGHGAWSMVHRAQGTEHGAQGSGLSVAVTANDESGDQGFTEGNPFTLKIWKASTNKEYTVVPEIIKGASTFLKHESTLASLAKYATTGLDNIILPGEIDLKIYPNSTGGKIYISAGNVSLKGLWIEVINTLGQVIISRMIDTEPGEIDLSGNVCGLYYVKVSGETRSKTERIILK